MDADGKNKRLPLIYTDDTDQEKPKITADNADHRGLCALRVAAREPCGRKEE
jgi:hypothetical protein